MVDAAAGREADRRDAAPGEREAADRERADAEQEREHRVEGSAVGEDGDGLLLRALVADPAALAGVPADGRERAEEGRDDAREDVERPFAELGLPRLLGPAVRVARGHRGGLGRGGVPKLRGGRPLLQSGHADDLESAPGERALRGLDGAAVGRGERDVDRRRGERAAERLGLRDAVGMEAPRDGRGRLAVGVPGHPGVADQEELHGKGASSGRRRRGRPSGRSRPSSRGSARGAAASPP